MEKTPITNSEETNGFSPSHRWDLQPTPDQFTGKIDRVRQNETLTSVRHSQPPLTIRSRPPGSIQGGHSLTDSFDFVDSVRVRESCSVDSVDNELSSHNLENFSLRKIVYKYKDLCMKETAATHHEKSLAAFLERGETPQGIFKPIYKTLMSNMAVLFVHDEAFGQDLRHLTEVFCRNVSCSLMTFWCKRSNEMRKSARALKTEIYTICNNTEDTPNTQTIRKMDIIEKQIARKNKN